MNIADELLAFRELPVEEVMSLLVAKIRAARIAAKESQEVFAARAGVTLRTYKRFEAGDSASLLTFLQALRALGRSAYLVQLFPGEVAKVKPLPRQITSGQAATGDLLALAQERARLVERRLGEERRRDTGSDADFDG